MNAPLTKIQDGMAEILKTLGFDAMAAGVKTETDLERLHRYAAVIIKRVPAERRNETKELLARALAELEHQTSRK
jgi:hypothetical protein